MEISDSRFDKAHFEELSGDPVLTAILNGDDVDSDQALCFINDSNNAEMLWSYALSVSCDQGSTATALAATRLLHFCIESSHLRNDVKANFTYLRLLHQLGHYDEFHAQCCKMSCCLAADVVELMMQRHEKCLRLASEIVLLQTVVNPARLCCTEKLIKIWLEVLHSEESSVDGVAENVSKMLELVSGSCHRIIFLKVLVSKFGVKLESLSSGLAETTIRQLCHLMSTVTDVDCMKTYLIQVCSIVRQLYHGNTEISQACVSAARRLRVSMQHQQRESEPNVDLVIDMSDCDATSGCNLPDSNSDQYCSLLELISSLLSGDKLDADSSEADGDRLVNRNNSETAENCTSSRVDRNSTEPITTEDHECTPGLTGNCQQVETNVVPYDRIEENRIIDKSSDDMKPLGKLDIMEVEGSDIDGRKSDRVRSVSSLIMEDDDAAAKNDLTDEDYISDEDEEDKPLVKLCGRKVGRENGHDGGEANKPSRTAKDVECDDKAIQMLEPSDASANANVLWKEGDIEVRLEIGDDEASASATFDDETDKGCDACAPDDFCNLPENRTSRTSIRISLSKLTSRVDVDACNRSVNCTSSAKAVPDGRKRVKHARHQKPKIRKNPMKLRRSRSSSSETSKLRMAKLSTAGKMHRLPVICSVDKQTEVTTDSRSRRRSSRSTESTLSETMNGICTRRMRNNSEVKHVLSQNVVDTMPETNVKSFLKDSTASKSKKRRASHGVEYIDDDMTSSPHCTSTESGDVILKKKTRISSHVDDSDATSAHADHVKNCQLVSDKENGKHASHKSLHDLNTRKLSVATKCRKSGSSASSRSDISSHSESSVTDSVRGNIEENNAYDAVLLKQSKNVDISAEESHLDAEEKSQNRRTTEEVFRQIGRDGLECRFCHCELRTRTQLLQHTKMQCHLRQKSLPNGAGSSAVSTGKRHSSDVEVCTSQTENESQNAAGSCDSGTDKVDQKTDALHVDAINGVHVKNCIIEISPLTEKVDMKPEAEAEVKPRAEQSNKAKPAAGADCVCDGCGEVVPDCSWLTAHIVTCPGRAGTGDEMSSESFQPDGTEWTSEQQSGLTSESGLDQAGEDGTTQPVEVDAASLLQLLCTVENSLLCTVASETDAASQPITVASDNLLEENGNTPGTAAGSSDEVGQIGREVIHDGVSMYEFPEYRCSLCPVTFLDRAAAIRHATSTKVHAACTVEHTHIYCCMQCDMRYRDQQLMWYHVTYICQQSEAAAVPASEMHRCVWCLKQFLTAEYLSRHCHVQHSIELSNIDSQIALRELAQAADSQPPVAGGTDAANSETQKQVLQALARATMRNGANSSPKCRKEAALLRSKLIVPPNSLPVRRTAKGIVYKNVFMQCIVSYICSNCGRDLSAKSSKREHRVAAPQTCFDSGPGGRRLFTYVRHYSYLCPYCNERSATQKACRAHQLTTCLPRMGVKTDELNHKQLLCPFCQRKYFNVITLKGHMTLVHQISRAESNQLLAGVTGTSEEVGATIPHSADRMTVNTASLSDSSSNTGLLQAACALQDNVSRAESIAEGDDDEDDNSVASDEDSNSIKSESESRDSRFETVDPSEPLFTTTKNSASSALIKNKGLDDSCSSHDLEDDNVDSDDDNRSVQFPASLQHRFSAFQKPKRIPSSTTKKKSCRKS